MRWRWFVMLTFMSLALAAGRAAPSAAAQADQRCFPETQQCIRGRFRQYWEQHGGLPVFGYPVSPQQPGQTYVQQWFERARFELHPQNPAPYDVLLARLGDQRLQQLGVDWRTDFPSGRGAPDEDCLDFSQTNQSVCNKRYQAGQCIGGCLINFRHYWETHGLEFDGRPGTSYAESLALFGLPLSSAYIDMDATGGRVMVQWFERVRFEWHPNNPEEFRVLLGRLGVEVLNPVHQPDVPTTEQPSPELIQQARERLARHLGISAASVTLERAEAHEWPDSGLGCPAPDQGYLQVITPGFLLIFAHNNTQFAVHTDASGREVVLCQNSLPIQLPPATSSTSGTGAQHMRATEQRVLWI